MFNRTTSVAAMLGTALFTAATANAAFISFASDTDPDNPTFVADYLELQRGVGGSTIVNNYEPTFVSLIVDPDDDGPLGDISLAARLDVEMRLDYVSSVQVAPGFYTHLFSLVGEFSFTPADDVRVQGDPEWSLTGTITEGEAIFAGIGSSTTVNSASMTGFNIDYDLVNVPVLGSAQNLLGDFGFTLTDINNGAGADLVTAQPRGGSGPLDNIVGINDFDSEASFSGSFVPTPSTLALIAPLGVFASRRRR